MKENSGSVDFEKTALNVSAASIVMNTLLSFIKLGAGMIAHSNAMISDAVHSASDVFSSIIVIIGIKISSKKADKSHPYGHERFECVAAVVLAGVLLVTGLFIGRAALEGLVSGTAAVMPGRLAAAAAVISVICKEAMFRYTKIYAVKFDSAALLADAWHHRSDALSSVGALIGIVGARMGLSFADNAASLVICVFIAKAAYDIFKDAVSKMVDSSCSEEQEENLRACALLQDGVLGVDKIQTRIFGNRIYVDIEISADGSLTLEKAHETAEAVHDAIETQFPDVKHVMVHVNPFKGQ